MKKILFIVFVCVISFSLSWCWWNKDKNADKWYVGLDTGSDTVAQPMWNEVSSYLVETAPRDSALWEDIYLYDDKWNLVLSLNDENQPQYLFVLYGNFVILDSWTSASQREMLVYDIPSGELIYRTEYYPWENGLVMNDDEITFYKKIDDALLSGYTLPQCENEYDNWYIENYGYVIWEDQSNDLWDVLCAYFE